MTPAQRRLVELLLIIGAVALAQALRRRPAKTETARSGGRLRPSDFIPPSDWNGFLRLVIFLSVGISAMWLFVLGLIMCESILWAAKQVTGAAPTSQWILALAGLSMILPWVAFAKAARRLGLGDWLNSSFTAPSIGVAVSISLIAASGVALWVLLAHYDLLSWV